NVDDFSHNIYNTGTTTNGVDNIIFKLSHISAIDNNLTKDHHFFIINKREKRQYVIVCCNNTTFLIIAQAMGLFLDGNDSLKASKEIHFRLFEIYSTLFKLINF
ncbi:hypothetical protein ACJX0J_020916, partial [Zea mays]